MKQIDHTLKQIFTLAFTAALILAIQSCTDESCYEPTTAPMRVSAYDFASKTPITADKITVNTPDGEVKVRNISLFGIGQEKDSVLYKDQTPMSALELPLRLSSGITAYRIVYQLDDDTDVADTIITHHTNREAFLSVYCGCVFFHTIDSMHYTNHVLNSVDFINQNITNEQELHVAILY